MATDFNSALHEYLALMGQSLVEIRGKDFDGVLSECLNQKERLNEKYAQIFQTLKEALGRRPLVLYGLTSLISGKILYVFMEHGLQVACLCDPQDVGGKFCGVPVIGPQTLKNDFADATVVVCFHTGAHDHDTGDVLAALGFQQHRIIPWEWVKTLVKLNLSTFDPSKPFQQHVNKYSWAYDLFEDEASKQTALAWLRKNLLNTPMDMPSPCEKYFEDGYISFGGREIFVDGGANEGESAIAFIKQIESAKGGYAHIYSFEPDSVHYALTVSNLSNYPNVTVVPKGMWTEETELTFLEEGMAGMASSFVLNSINGVVVSNVPVTSLDIFFAGAPDSELPTFIKMDIEGAEKEALTGASDIIRRVKPKLAICAYHKTEDIYVLPQTILRIRDDYRFALRQHAPELHEIILYAV